ncbi:MAG: thioester reductase domain-containing protein [Vicinamibacterales bacterium]
MPSPPSVHPPLTSQERLLALVAATVGQPLTTSDLDAPLGLLGFDSLRLIELLATIEQEVGSPLSPDAANESTTVRELATLIDDGDLQSPEVSSDDRIGSMLADSALPADIIPGPAAIRGSLLDCRAILVTGATGFLGGQLAADMIRRSHATLYCLVRRRGDGLDSRLRARLVAAGIPAETIDDRVIAIEADLTRPDLGLTPDDRTRLESTAEAIVHAAAAVNWIASYDQLRATNVLGTLALLRLASRGPRGIPFHFISSLSTCCPAGGPRTIREDYDTLTGIRGLHLGYAQTKAVGEALVAAAGRRGLPVVIYRPSLIAGHSRTAEFNRDDLLSLLIRGCVAMGTAPDLDWSLDCEPVDVVCAQILALSGETCGVAHLKHPRPRHWRECLLWMRLSGYALRLVPYAGWLEQLHEEIRRDRTHPLAPLQAFLATRYDGLTLPELYQDTRRSQVNTEQTDARLSAGAHRPALDAALLERYFAAYRLTGYLPAPANAHTPPVTLTPDFDAAFFTAACAARGRTVAVQAVQCVGSGSEHSVIGELTAWQSGLAAGIHRYALTVGTGPTCASERVVLKVKPHANDALAVGQALAGLCDRRVDEAYRRWRDHLGLSGSHGRERWLHEHAPQALTRFMPALLGVTTLDERGSCALVLEDLSGARLLDSVVRTPHWRAEDIAVAIDGLSALHAAAWGADSPGGWSAALGPRRTTEAMTRMADWWSALATHAAGAFVSWGGADLPALHRALIDSIPSWHPDLDEQPAVVIHHDCNPRNLCIRQGRDGQELCAYDWELATISAPQRDLAEFLCFVLPADVKDDVVERWVEAHRVGLERHAAVEVSAEAWRRGFAAALNELLIDRLAMYALVHRVRPQTFLPRVVSTWRRLHACAARAVAA